MAEGANQQVIICMISCKHTNEPESDEKADGWTLLIMPFMKPDPKRLFGFQVLRAIREIFSGDVGRLCFFPEILHFYPDPGLSFRDPEAAVIIRRIF